MPKKYGVRIYPILDTDRIRIKQTVYSSKSKSYTVDTMEDGEHREKHVNLHATVGIADAVRQALGGKLKRG